MIACPGHPGNINGQTYPYSTSARDGDCGTAGAGTVPFLMGIGQNDEVSASDPGNFSRCSTDGILALITDQGGFCFELPAGGGNPCAASIGDDAGPRACCLDGALKASGAICRSPSESTAPPSCSLAATCDGTHPYCPRNPPAADGTACEDQDGDGSICRAGACVEVCAHIDLGGFVEQTWLNGRYIKLDEFVRQLPVFSMATNFVGRSDPAVCRLEPMEQGTNYQLKVAVPGWGRWTNTYGYQFVLNDGLDGDFVGAEWSDTQGAWQEGRTFTSECCNFICRNF